MASTKLTKANAKPALADATDMIWHKTTIRMYGVSDHQLEELTAGYNSWHLVCFGICAGAAIALLIAFAQAPHGANERVYYFSSFLILACFTVVFGINGFSNYRRAQNCKRKLFQESVPIEK